MDWTKLGYNQGKNVEDDSEELSVCVTAEQIQMKKYLLAEHFMPYRSLIRMWNVQYVLVWTGMSTVKHPVVRRGWTKVNVR